MEFVGSFCRCLKDQPDISNTREVQLTDLDNAMKDLKAIKEDLQAQNIQGTTSRIGRWWDKANDKETQFEEFRRKYIRATRPLSCLLSQRIQRRAAKLLKETEELIRERNDLQLISLLPSASLEENPETDAPVLDSVLMPKREEILGYIGDSRVRMVGIWGMGGVGKTALLQSIRRSWMKEGRLPEFNYVILVAASQEAQWQMKVTEQLELPPGSTQQDIRDFLRDKNFLLLIDNISQQAADIIPQRVWMDVGSRQYKQKVVFTTRSEGVCASMKPDVKIKLSCLEFKDAWELFKHSADPQTIDSNPKVEQLAKEVTRECGGLPLALQVTGRAMKNKRNPVEWSYVLESLKNSRTVILPDIERVIFPVLRTSYENLGDQTLKKCFQYCSLWPAHSHILKDELIECWIGFGYIADYETIVEAYQKGDDIIKRLEEACLLEICETTMEPCVKLHVVLRNMALWLASERGWNKDKWIVRDGVGLTGVSREDAAKWTDTERVSLIRNEIRSLPSVTAECGALKSIMLQQQTSLCKIPEGFFQQMPILSYLNLSLNRIEVLPADIRCLVNLVYLNISSTLITTLPSSLKKLEKLKYLLCRHCKIRDISRGLIQRLRMLQVFDLFPHGYLGMENIAGVMSSGDRFKAIGMKVSDDVFPQLAHLPSRRLNLSRLDNSAIDFGKLDDKNGACLQVLQIKKCSALGELILNGSGEHLEHLLLKELLALNTWSWKTVPESFFSKLRQLEIYRCHSLENLTWVIHLPCLLNLLVENCRSVEQLITLEEEDDEKTIRVETEENRTFPELKQLTINRLPSLGSLSNQQLDFPRLCSLRVTECPSLKKLSFKQDIINNKFKYIICDAESWNGLQWECPDENIKKHLSKNRV